MSSGVLTPAFLQAAGRAGKSSKNVISFISEDANLVVFDIRYNGEITINTISGGEPSSRSYGNGREENTSMLNDAGTQVSIIGDVTKIVFYNWDDDTEEPVNISSLNVTKCKTLTSLDISWCQNLTSIDVSKNTALTGLSCNNCAGLSSLDVSKNTALTDLSCDSCAGLSSLDLSENPALTNFSCNSCAGLSSLDLSANTALTYLNCGTCNALTALDISKNTALTNLVCAYCTGLTTISYPATNSDVSTEIAGAITDATSADGTVYTDSAAAYYSTIETAANNRGWAIEQL